MRRKPTRNNFRRIHNELAELKTELRGFSSQRAPAAATDEVGQRMELFRIYREYVEHEDQLINHRTSWNLAIQSFLFAAYVLSLNGGLETAKAESATKTLDSLLQAALLRQEFELIANWLLPTIGAVVSILSAWSAWTARESIQALRNKWNELPGRCTLLPDDLTGGGLTKDGYGVRVAVIGIPISIALLWLILLILHVR